MKFQCSYVFPVISSKTWDKMLVMKRFKLHANSILGVDSWQRIDSAFLESGFVSVFFMHVYMYTCIHVYVLQLNSFLMLKIMFNIKHWYRTFQISHTQVLKFFAIRTATRPRWVAQEIWSGATGKKNGLASWSSEPDEQKGIERWTFTMEGDVCMGIYSMRFFWRGGKCWMIHAIEGQ